MTGGGVLTTDERAAAALALRTAEHDKVGIAPLVEAYPHMDVEDSYRVQLINIGLRLDAGCTVVGHKVGLSSEAMQQMMGVGEPAYGHLLSDMVLTEETAVDAGRFLLPRVEPEVGFILGDDLP